MTILMTRKMSKIFREKLKGTPINFYNKREKMVWKIIRDKKYRIQKIKGSKVKKIRIKDMKRILLKMMTI